METLTQIIFVLAIVQYSLQAALSGRLLKRSVYALAAALWAMGIYPWVIRMPMTYLGAHLALPQWVGDAVLIVTVEAIAAILLQLGASGDKPTKARRVCRFFNALPGPVFFCAVGYFESRYFGFRAGGHSFLLTAVEFALLTGVAVLGLGSLLQVAVRENVYKRELRLLLCMLSLGAGLLAYAALFPMPVSAPRAPMAWDALAALLAGAGLLFACGRYAAVFAPLKRLFVKH